MKNKKPNNKEEKIQKLAEIIRSSFEKENEGESKEENEEEFDSDLGLTGFVDFSPVRDMPTATLQQTGGAQTLEQDVENAPRKEVREEAQEEPKYIEDYNVRNYEEEIRQDRKIQEAVDERRLRSSGTMLSRADVEQGQTRRTFVPETWHEMTGTRGGGRTAEDYIAKVERVEDERKLPFEEKRKYKGRRV